MALEFVDGWVILQTLGEGAYGEVKLLANRDNGDLVAMKIIDMRRHPEAKNCVKKEVLIHQKLVHPHIISFLGMRQHKQFTYIFLEYAPHGELFDKIEPDVGMDVSSVKKYTHQLLDGVEFIHSQGIAHRDLKPENLLLDANDDLKISDFGLATPFRVQRKERLLEKRCGTLPYVAPEVLFRPYAAEPADIWSIGIIIVAMLAGELPWDKAESKECKEFRLWKSGSYMGISPWNKIDTVALSLVRKVLAPLPSKRLKLSEIKQHSWFRQSSRKRKREIEEGHAGGEESEEGRRVLLEGRVSCSVHSQPARATETNSDPLVTHLLAFSQPVAPQDMFLPSQGFVLTQSNSSQTPLQKLVKRMTRFFVSLPPEAAFTELSLVLDKLSLEWKINDPGFVTIEAVDKRKNQLVFKASIVGMEVTKTLFDFRLSKGCGIEFKRHFVSIKSLLSDFITTSSLWTSDLA